MRLLSFPFALSLILCACASTQDADQKKMYDAQQSRLAEIRRVAASLGIDVETLKSSPNQKRDASFERTVFTAYSERLRDRIEHIGTKNYPKGLYGTVIVSIEVMADGSVANVDIVRTSGTKELDDAALRIGHLVAPFERFSSAMNEKADSLVMVLSWNFFNDQIDVQTTEKNSMY